MRRGVYAVGRPELTRAGVAMATLLACRPGAVLSHGSAGDLWGIVRLPTGLIELSVPGTAPVCLPGVRVHRRSLPEADMTRHRAVPVTTVACTLLDLAVRLTVGRLEAAINEADKLGLISIEALRVALGAFAGRRGVRPLRSALDRHTFTLTDSELERRFLPLARAAGLGQPRTQDRLNGFRVDFHWPGLGLIVETDGLRYHRTPAQQVRDRRRDQAHTVAGLTPLRFTHAQVAFEPAYVQATLRQVAERLGGEASRRRT